MHYLISLLTIYMVWHRGVWRNWNEYHATMLFFGFMELIYNLITHSSGYFLWKLIPDMYLTRVPMLALYLFIIFPCSTLLYLTKYPDNLLGQILYIFKWSIVYTAIESIGYMTNRIVYFPSWNIGYSFIFNLILFWGLQYHHRKPLKAYIAFIIVTIAGILAFDIRI